MALQPTDYTDYSIQSAYAWDYGLLQAAVAGAPGTACEILEPQAPVCMRLVTWCAQAQGQLPVPPDFQTSSNERLMQKVIAAPLVSTMPDGTQIITIAGVYYYALIQPPSDGDIIPSPASPSDTGPFPAFTPTQFIQGVLGFIQASQAGPWGGRSASDKWSGGITGTGGGGGLWSGFGP